MMGDTKDPGGLASFALDLAGQNCSWSCRLPQSDYMVIVQIFGLKSAQAHPAAERSFKERRVSIQLVDLKQKPMAPGEIKRFIERFGLTALLDREGKTY